MQADIPAERKSWALLYRNWLILPKVAAEGGLEGRRFSCPGTATPLAPISALLSPCTVPLRLDFSLQIAINWKEVCVSNLHEII